MIPSISRVGVLTVAAPTGLGSALKEYEVAAHGLKIPIQTLQVIRGPNPDLEGAFREARKGRVSALIVTRNAVLTPHTKRIVDLAIKTRLPSMHEVSDRVEAGGLMSYGANDGGTTAARLCTSKTEALEPADLPVDQPTKFELVFGS